MFRTRAACSAVHPAGSRGIAVEVPYNPMVRTQMCSTLCNHGKCVFVMLVLILGLCVLHTQHFPMMLLLEVNTVSVSVFPIEVARWTSSSNCLWYPGSSSSYSHNLKQKLKSLLSSIFPNFQLHHLVFIIRSLLGCHGDGSVDECELSICFEHFMSLLLTAGGKVTGHLNLSLQVSAGWNRDAIWCSFICTQPHMDLCRPDHKSDCSPPGFSQTKCE